MVDQLGKIRANSENWKKTKKVLMVYRIMWAMNTFMAYRAPGLDGMYPVSLQKGLDITIKCLTELFRGSLAIGDISIFWTNVRVVPICKTG